MSSDHILGRSLDLSTQNIYNTQINDLKAEITELKTNLLSTQSELEHIILQNIELKKHLTNMTQEVNILKQLCRSPVSTLRQSSATSSKKKARRRLTNSFRNTPELPNENKSPDEDQIKPDAESLNQKNEPEVVVTNREPIKTININENKPAKMSTKEVFQEKNLFIFGGEQCRNLSHYLRKTRVNTNYVNYNIKSFIKPNATTEEILRSVKLFDISQEDRVIICIGQHDSNPFKILTELCVVLKSLNCSVLILKVFNNRYLNEVKLNTMLHMITKQYKNAMYVNLKSYNYYTNTALIREICHELNIILDQLDYNLKYLTFSRLRSNKPTGQFNNLDDRSRMPLKINAETQTEPIHDSRKTTPVAIQSPVIEIENSNSSKQFFRD